MSRPRSKQPDDVKSPQCAESLAAIRQARTKKGLLSYNSVDELMAGTSLTDE